MRPCHHGIMTSDRLAELGRRHRRLRADLDALRPLLAEAIREAHADGMAQVDVVKATGYTRDQVRQICLPAERRRVRARSEINLSHG
jgi:hypothetical protein